LEATYKKKIEGRKETVKYNFNFLSAAVRSLSFDEFVLKLHGHYVPGIERS